MGGNGFPSMDAGKFKRILVKKLGYTEVPDSGKGSHTWLKAPGRQDIRWAFHGREVSSVEVARVLTKQAGLTKEEALEVLR